MKYVRLDEQNKVVEILPESTYELGIEHWYGAEFAAQCVEAPDDITEGMYYIDKEFVEEERTEVYRINQARKRMRSIKARLSELDWQTAKFIDGQITEEEYEPFKRERISLREEFETIQSEYGEDDLL